MRAMFACRARNFHTQDCVRRTALQLRRAGANLRESGASMSRKTLLPLAAIPSLGAFAGGWLDERAHLGFTNWRGACRAAGLAPASLIHFTKELLPTAIAGTLLGGLLLLGLGFALRNRDDLAHACAAAHVGCALAMPLAFLLCALALPVGAMFAVDALLAACAAALVLRFLPPRVNRITPHP
jgi:hypothetical protein